ncbi:OmcA/MtrC family decaheme c-type cytochrome [Ferrimonas balearica]|uniref:OmcA/MtrC family decaheme c-type cytochrome n=1 Tax=Ferrimonas balearica TaxID=44012 RepID=UPI001C997803|nr:OmcA/MtrC family decaheme c-type cytochrome [Ferrimonas balearica]MBY5992230.1 OmcA/MtrC family decaheme c-type cytochrome [Ferrimonas balearica]
MRTHHLHLLALALASAMALSACGDDGKDGAPGEAGPPGPPGDPGAPGLPAGSFATTAENASDLTFTLTPEGIAFTDEFGIEFELAGLNPQGDTVPFVGLDRIAIYLSHLTINQEDIGAPTAWASHSYLSAGASSMYCAIGGGEITVRGNTYKACTLVEGEPGHYTGTWEHADTPAPVILEGDDMDLTHRLWLRAYNIVDATGNGVSDKVLSERMDFIPATGEVLEDSGRDIVSDTACQGCHGGEEGGIISNIHAHHNYQSVGNCVNCHNPFWEASEEQVAEGWNEGNWDLTVLVHRLHAGSHIADSLSGEALEFMGHIHYPGELNNCLTCHEGNTAFTDNLYRDACVACHIDTDPRTGENHGGIVISTDAACINCHGSGALGVMAAHEIGIRDTLRDAFYAEVDPATIMVTPDPLDPTLTTVSFGFKAYLNGAEFTGDLATLDFISSAQKWLVNFQADSGYALAYTAYGTGSAPFQEALYNGTHYATSTTAPTSIVTGSGVIIGDVRLCANDGALTTCGAEIDDTISLAMKSDAVYFDTANPANPDVVMSRYATDEGGVVSIAKCNDCHGDIAYGKRGHHGVDKIEQCVHCHNENVIFFKGSARDLGLNTHKFHAGHSEYFGEGESIGYPNLLTDCQACHVSDQWFDGSGALQSGKTGFRVSLDLDNVDRVSPVAATCLACHESDAVAAHAASQGAIVDPANAVPNPPVESCAVCHADVHSF